MVLLKCSLLVLGPNFEGFWSERKLSSSGSAPALVFVSCWFAFAFWLFSALLAAAAIGISTPQVFFWPHRRIFWAKIDSVGLSLLLVSPNLTLVQFCSWSPPPPSSQCPRLQPFHQALPTFTTSSFLYLSLLARSLFKTSMHL